MHTANKQTNTPYYFYTKINISIRAREGEREKNLLKIIIKVRFIFIGMKNPIIGSTFDDVVVVLRGVRGWVGGIRSREMRVSRWSYASHLLRRRLLLWLLNFFETGIWYLHFGIGIAILSCSLFRSTTALSLRLSLHYKTKPFYYFINYQCLPPTNTTNTT